MNFIYPEKKLNHFILRRYTRLYWELEKSARFESIRYLRYRDPYEGHKDLSYWDQVAKNQEEIAESATSALDAIRNRVERWERIQEIT